MVFSAMDSGPFRGGIRVLGESLLEAGAGLVGGDPLGGHQHTDGLVDGEPDPQHFLETVGVRFAGLGAE